MQAIQGSIGTQDRQQGNRDSAECPDGRHEPKPHAALRGPPRPGTRGDSSSMVDGVEAELDYELRGHAITSPTPACRLRSAVAAWPARWCVPRSTTRVPKG